MVLFEFLLLVLTSLWQIIRKAFFALATFLCLVCFSLFFTAWGFFSFKELIIPPELKIPASYQAEGRIKIRYLGVSGYEVSDGQTVIILDPALTRPGFLHAASNRIDTNEQLLEDYKLTQADYILANHSHYDHAIDVATLAQRTGARVIGSRNTLNLARGKGIPVNRLIEARHGQKIRAGSFTITASKSKHAPIAGIEHPMGGIIKPRNQKRYFWQYRLDETFIFHLRSGDKSIWFHPTVIYHEGELLNLKADVLIYGATGGKMNPANVGAALRAVQPSLVLPTHYDNFFHPLAAGLSQIRITQVFDFARICKAEFNKASIAILDYNEVVQF